MRARSRKCGDTSLGRGGGLEHVEVRRTAVTVEPAGRPHTTRFAVSGSETLSPYLARCAPARSWYLSGGSPVQMRLWGAARPNRSYRYLWSWAPMFAPTRSGAFPLRWGCGCLRQWRPEPVAPEPLAAKTSALSPHSGARHVDHRLRRWWPSSNDPTGACRRRRFQQPLCCCLLSRILLWRNRIRGGTSLCNLCEGR